MSQLGLLQYHDPPGGSVALPVNTGDKDQNKVGSLGVWNLTTAGDVKSLGRVQLGGYGVVKKSGITINDYGTSPTCSTSEEGQERYNSSTKAIEYCNGTDWKASSSGSASSGG